MGFFSSFIGQQDKTKTPATGFYNLPGELQAQVNGLTGQIPGATAATNFMTPAYNQYQTQAFDQAQQFANPTSGDISNLVNTYMNPYNDAVLNQINTQANGQNSILKQTQAANGQIGSNRGVLQANDVDMQRLNQQQGFLQGQFNTALQTGLGQQQQGFQNLLGVGNQIQGNDYQNQQAAYQALLAQQKLLGGQASIYGNGRAADSSGGGFTLDSILNSDAAKSAAFAFSDRRIKNDIKYIGEENGHNIYEFKYKGYAGKWIGVMADEVEQLDPGAVHEIKGVKAVDYNRIGVKFRRAA